MNNPPNGPKYLKKTVDAIFQLKRDRIRPNISVKNIRRLKEIDGSNRSAVRFYTNALAFLVREKVLRQINKGSPKKYIIIDEIKLKNLLGAKTPI